MATQALDVTTLVQDVICSVGLAANFLVMAVFAATKKLRIKYYGLVFNLVVTDIALATGAILAQHIQHLATSILVRICLITEELNILAVAVNRLVALSVKPPGRYDIIVTRRRLVAASVLMWIVSAAIMVPLNMTVTFNVTQLVFPVIRLTALTLTGVVYAVVLAKIARYKMPLVSSAGIGKNDEQTGAVRLRRTRHLMVTFTVIFAVCCVCWLPFTVGNLVVFFYGDSFGHDQWLTLSLYLEVTSTALVASSAINPFVYWWRIDDFRVSLYDVVCVRCRRRQRAYAESVDIGATVDSAL